MLAAPDAGATVMNDNGAGEAAAAIVTG